MMTKTTFIALVNPRSGGNMGAKLLNRFKEILGESRVYNLNDEQLMKMFQEGDEHAYNQLVTKYKDRILNYIINFVGDYESAQDLAQDTFLKVFIKKKSYREIAKF